MSNYAEIEAKAEKLLQILEDSYQRFSSNEDQRKQWLAPLIAEGSEFYQHLNDLLDILVKADKLSGIELATNTVIIDMHKLHNEGQRRALTAKPKHCTLIAGACCGDSLVPLTERSPVE